MKAYLRKSKGEMHFVERIIMVFRELRDGGICRELWKKIVAI